VLYNEQAARPLNEEVMHYLTASEAEMTPLKLLRTTIPMFGIALATDLWVVGGSAVQLNQQWTRQTDYACAPVSLPLCYMQMKW
jgi:hypothetical protein